ncbi:MAG: hypothetical protein ACRD2L_17080 [Terriglobia bacterium]
MSVNLVVYHLIPGNNDIIEQWLRDLGDYLNRDQTLTGNNRVSIHRSDRVAYAVWTDLCRKTDAPDDSKLGEGTFQSDMKLLAESDSNEERKLLRKGDKQGKRDVYEPVAGMFN